MRLLDKVKHSIFAAVTVMAVGAMATTGIDASAKTITEPKQTTKQVTTVGSGAYLWDEEYYDYYNPLYDVANLKINGKKYTKGAIKKKVKTIQYSTNARAYKSWTGSFTEYYDDDAVYNTETYKKERLNYKWISTSCYDLTFLKPGTYKVSYDTYNTSSRNYNFEDSLSDKADFYWNDTADCYAQYEISADTKTAKVTPVLFKTQHVDTYKVVQTTEGLKTIALGKSKQTNTVSSNGTKTTSKTTYKNRYLKGKSGKVKYTMNKNYSLTSAIAVTRDAAGNIVITPANKNSKIAYSAGVYTKTESHKEYVLDAEGNRTYEVNPTTGLKDYSKPIKKEVVDGTHKAKYKETTIYYGYKDKYTGDYTKYGVASRAVYVHKKDADKKYMYEKDADGYNDYAKPVMEVVTATVLTKEYPVYEWINGAYTKVTYLYEMVLLPEDLTADKKFDIGTGIYTVDVDKENYKNTLECSSEYYLDAKRTTSMSSGEWELVSKNGLSTETLNAKGEWEHNPAVARAFFETQYKGSWVVYDKTTMDPEDCFGENYTRYADYVVNADGTKTYTYYAYKYELDADGEWIKNEANNKVFFNNSTSGVAYFKAK